MAVGTIHKEEFVAYHETSAEDRERENEMDGWMDRKVIYIYRERERERGECVCACENKKKASIEST